MARTLHTQPRAVLAARRLSAPLASRAADATRNRPHEAIPSPAATLRIHLIAPRPGFHHPARPQELRRLLDCVGPEARYGLRSIELRQAPTRRHGASPLFGRLDVPGRIVLYEQPIPPWRISGFLADGDARRMTDAGATVERLRTIEATMVHWPDHALYRFMLIEVFLHELGHHVFQHYSGKRPTRQARTRDHEAFAQGYVARWRTHCLTALGL